MFRVAGSQVRGSVTGDIINRNNALSKAWAFVSECKNKVKLAAVPDNLLIVQREASVTTDACD